MNYYRPRIYKGRFTWYCAGNGRCGEGYDPQHAYQDWWAAVRKKWTVDVTGSVFRAYFDDAIAAHPVRFPQNRTITYDASALKIPGINE